MEKLATLAAGSIVILILIAIVIILTIPVSNIIYKSIKKTSGYNASGCLVLCFAMWIFFPAYIIAVRRYSKEVKAKCEPVKERVQTRPDDKAVDDYMDMINEFGILNDPKTWNQVRAVWFVVNESPRVTTDKKRELRNFLMAKGLRLTNNDKNVIDNYKA